MVDKGQSKAGVGRLPHRDLVDRWSPRARSGEDTATEFGDGRRRVGPQIDERQLLTGLNRDVAAIRRERRRGAGADRHLRLRAGVEVEQVVGTEAWLQEQASVWRPGEWLAAEVAAHRAGGQVHHGGELVVP